MCRSFERPILRSLVVIKCKGGYNGGGYGRTDGMLIISMKVIRKHVIKLLVSGRQGLTKNFRGRKRTVVLDPFSFAMNKQGRYRGVDINYLFKSLVFFIFKEHKGVFFFRFLVSFLARWSLSCGYP